MMLRRTSEHSVFFSGSEQSCSTGVWDDEGKKYLKIGILWDLYHNTLQQMHTLS